MQDPRRPLLLVVVLVLGVFLVWRLVGRRDESANQATQPSGSGSAAGSAAATASGRPTAAPLGSAGGSSSAAQPVPAGGGTISLPPGATYAQRFAALCAACHGPNGRFPTPLTPVLA